MKVLQHISILFVFLLASCAKETETVCTIPEGKVEVRIDMPEVYHELSPSQMTKAAQDSETLSPYDNLITSLPVGATIWLSYAKKTGDSTYDTPQVKPYVVRSTADYVGLYPCETEEYTDKEGVAWLRVMADVEASPLYLEKDATYKFQGMYPALDIRRDNKEVYLSNGTWACTNDPRYTQTEGREATMTAGRNRVTYIELPPMINQTARLHFEISKGENVHTLEMMQAGIEIDGVQDKGTVFPLDWTHEDYLKVLQMESIADGEHWFKLQEFEVKDDKIIGNAYILPLDVRRTYIFILVNVAVNGIPTQYVATLNGIILEHARSYDFYMEVDVNGNLTVMNWQNTSLTITPTR